MDFGPGDSAQDLRGAGQVELRDAGKQQKPDVEAHQQRDGWQRADFHGSVNEVLQTNAASSFTRIADQLCDCSAP